MTKGLRRVTRNVVVVVGAVFAAVIVGMAVFAGLLAPHPPDEQNFDLIEARPGAQALFGTDRFGRDVLSRVIYGARVSLYVAVTSIGLAMLAGGALQLVRFEPDMTPVGELAESWETSRDGLTWTFKLRQGSGSTTARS